MVKKGSKKQTRKRQVKQAKPEKPAAKTPWIVIGLIAIVILLFLVSKPASSDPLELKLYVMSQCPYGTLAEDALFPVLAQFGDDVRLQLDYIATETPEGLQSLRGPTEIEGNIIQLCAKQYYPETYLDFILCMNENPLLIPANWESCAGRAGLDTATLAACADGEEGTTLLQASAKNALAHRITGSPSLFIDGIPYRGRRDPASYLKAICARIPLHPACETLPACGSDADCTEHPELIGRCIDENTEQAKCDYEEPVSFEVLIINDETCRSCDVSRITYTTEKLFKGAHHRTIDVTSEEAQWFIKQFNLKVVPVFLFSTAVRDSKVWDDYPALQSAFTFGGPKYFRLTDEVTRSRYLIDEKERIAYQKSIDIITDDNRPRLDLFLMSACTHDLLFEQSLERVLKVIGDAVDVEPHYLSYADIGHLGNDLCIDEEEQYCSPQGAAELRHDLRELCVFDQLGRKAWLAFTIATGEECAQMSLDACWKSAAAEAGIAPEFFDSCSDDPSRLRQGNRQERMAVLAGPSLFVDGEEYVGPQSPESMKSFICQFFENPPAGCDVPLAAGEALQPDGSPIAPTCGY